MLSSATEEIPTVGWAFRKRRLPRCERGRARDVGEGLVFGELELCHTGGGVQVVQSHRTFCPQLIQQLVKAVVGLLSDQNVTR